MVHQLLNTLYVMTPESYLRLDHETVKVEAEGTTKLQVPLHHLGALFCFGNVMMSPALIHRCAEDGRSVVLFDQNGRFKARVEGPVSGNVLLRCAQHEARANTGRTLSIARNLVGGKVQNTRQVALRAAREATSPEEAAALTGVTDTLAGVLKRLEVAEEIEVVRGLEGEAARTYFDTFGYMVREDRATFHFNGRNRRPPRDPVNALLSFVYALLLNDCVAAAEGVGLDPQMGFLHTVRPGRPSLALDLIEELRSVLADRLVLTLINRRQITGKSFMERPGGAVYLNEDGRREVVVAYQKRKQEEIQHPLLKEKIPFGLVPHIQARLLARLLRGDIESYPPFLYR